MEHRAAQRNFAECGIVLFLASFLPFSIGLFLIYSLTSLFVLPTVTTEGFKMFQMLFLGTLFFHFTRESAKKDIDTWINIIATFFLVNIFWVILQASGHQIYFSLGPESSSSPVIGLPGIMGQRVFQGILCAVAAPILLKKSLWFSPFILVGLYFSKCSVAIAAALAGVVFLYPKKLIFLVPIIIISFLFIKKDINFSQLMIYQQSIPLIKNHWFGQGIGSFHNAHIMWQAAKMWWREAHNEYYQLYFEFGILGISIFLLFLCEMIYIFFRNRKDAIITILSASLLAFLVSCLGQPVMHVVRIAVLGVIIAALMYARSDQLKGI